MGALESSTPADKEEECGPVGRKFCEQVYTEKTSLLETVHEPGLVKVPTECGGGRDTWLLGLTWKRKWSWVKAKQRLFDLQTCETSLPR